jgi:UDP-N-acetylmuramoyl-L-alanyl-D-glutamate--2,6-diaminopimelate ligase
MRAYQQLKNVYHLLQSLLWRVVYGMPDSGLKIFGVTGTNGKTTTSFMLRSILAAAYGEEKVGMLTTVAFRLGKEEEINETKMTTLPSRMVWRYLAHMQKASVTHVVLEITSHALDQHRLFGIKLDGGIMLNIEREHLDYHKTMEAYAAAKAKIVHYLKKDAPLIGKSDDARVEAILRQAQAHDCRVVRFTSSQAAHVQTSLTGDVNKENALAASLLGRAIGLGEDVINKGIMDVTKVPGRMEKVEAPQGFSVIIDYAVTPDALERLYSFVRKETKGKVYGLLGAAGLRDRGKRPDMARIVKEYSDFLAITREDPWTENEEQIFSDLEKGLKTDDPSWKRIVDRREALTYLISQAKAGDTVVVTGKGAETGMAVGHEIIPWNERKIVEEIIASL